MANFKTFKTLNVVDPSDEHLKKFEKFQRDFFEKYQAVAAIPARPTPIFGPKYKTVGEIISARNDLGNSRSLAGKMIKTLINAPREAVDVFAHMDSSLRKDHDKMLSVLFDYPQALYFADESLMTKDFFLEALNRNKNIYDVLPKDAQHDPDIVDAYRRLVCKDRKPFQILNVSPACPQELFATPQLYKEGMVEALLGYDSPQEHEVWFGHYEFDIGDAAAKILTVRTMAPYLDFEKLDLEAFEEAKNMLLEKGKKTNVLTDFIQKYDPKHTNQHGLRDFEEELVNKKSRGTPKQAVLVKPVKTKLTETQLDMRQTQQKIKKDPVGNHNWDRTIVQYMRNYPEGYKDHIDAKEYLERRAEYFLGNTPKQYPQNAENFKAIIASCPEAKAIVAQKLAEKGIADPEKWLETPLTKMTYTTDVPAKSLVTDTGSHSQFQETFRER